MAVFAYFRKNIDGPPRVGIAAVKRIKLGVGGWIGLLIGLAALDLTIRLMIELAK